MIVIRYQFIFINFLILINNFVLSVKVENALCAFGTCTTMCSGYRNASHYVIHPNGCGTEKLSIFLNKAFNRLNQILRSNYKYTACCNAHDACYSSCESSKSECDQEMFDCFMRQGRRIHNGVTLVFAKLLLTQPFACCAYDKAQREYCHCSQSYPCVFPNVREVVSCLLCRIPILRILPPFRFACRLWTQ